jgi:pyruvate formate lyase activating enzyme
MKGLVGRIQRFSTGDGPGIRTTVFLKGCNLRCAWCHNPELTAMGNELRFTASNCADCRSCVAACAHGAWSLDPSGARVFDSGRCEVCGTCATRCPYDALDTVARWAEPEDVLATVLRDKAYYDNSGGGLTLSGGEPLLQAGFARALLAGARERAVHTALDTAACVPWETLEPLLAVTDLVLLDVKSMDSAVHERWTGVPNEMILENARRLAGAAVDVIVRIPVVPGVNDGEDDCRRCAEFLAGFPRLRGVELLPYHGLGVEKVRVLQRPEAQQRFATPAAARIRRLSEIFADLGIHVLSKQGEAPC